MSFYSVAFMVLHLLPMPHIAGYKDEQKACSEMGAGDRIWKFQLSRAIVNCKKQTADPDWDLCEVLVDDMIISSMKEGKCEAKQEFIFKEGKQ